MTLQVASCHCIDAQWCSHAVGRDCCTCVVMLGGWLCQTQCIDAQWCSDAVGRDCCTCMVMLQVAEYMADRLCTRPDQDISRDFLRLMCHPPDCSTILKVLQHFCMVGG